MDTSCLNIPDAFSPNGDGLNDYFFPIGNQQFTLHEFKIYNRWGELIHNNIAPWDGNYKDKKQELDVYTYFIQYDCFGEKITVSGNLTLIR